MPLYEYHCNHCGQAFELLRSFSKADTPAPCPACSASDSKRAISRCAARIRGSDGSATSAAGSSGCAGCSRGSCAGCDH